MPKRRGTINLSGDKSVGVKGNAEIPTLAIAQTGERSAVFFYDVKFGGSVSEIM